MPFRDAQTHFTDILDAIALIERFIGSMGFDEYKEDLKTQSAVERQLQVVTEAAYRLKDDEALCPSPNWKGYRDMGNILRHGYHKVDNKVVWDTVINDLPPLKQAVEEALQKHFSEPKGGH